MKTPQTATCHQCLKNYQAKSSGSRYCSGACRAKASRAARGASVDNPALASARRNATKGAKVISRACRFCGQAFTCDGKAAKRLYCSTRCKKQAFNARHRE
jgi:endogenous inhibitor of DNA gyrase (YacG/DUF329 family)